MSNIDANQLKELAPLINSFKSEEVQLRVIEAVLGGRLGLGGSQAPARRRGRPSSQPTADVVVEDSGPAPKKKRRGRPPGSGRKRSIFGGGDEAPASPAPRKKKRRGRRSRGGTGASAMTTKLLGQGYFKSARTIADVTDKCRSLNSSREYKANEFSPVLLRMFNDGKLTRDKNDKNNFIYQEA